MPRRVRLCGAKPFRLSPLKTTLPLSFLSEPEMQLMRVVSSELNVLIVGVLLVFFVVAAPEGIIGLFKKFGRARAARAARGGTP